MHGFARDLPTMLRLIAEFWRTPASRYALRAHPEGAWIAVTGDVDPLGVRARATRAVRRMASRRGSGPSPSPSAQPAPLKDSRPLRPLVFRVGTSSVRTLLDAARTGRDDPDRVAMTLLDEVLGGNGDLDSRLAIEVRRRRGLAYTIGSHHDPDIGRFFVYLRIAARPIPRRARARCATSSAARERIPSRAQSSTARATNCSRRHCAHESNPSGHPRPAQRRRAQPPAAGGSASLAARYDAVTLADVRRVARTRLTPDTMIEFDEGPVP